MLAADSPTVFARMSMQLVGGALISILGLATLAFALFQRMRKSRLRRDRALTDAAASIQRCWQIAERVPTAYLPPSLRRLIARLVQSTSSRTLKLDPKNTFLREQETRSRMMLASAAREAQPNARPMLSPKDRKAVTDSLRDLKRLAQYAKQVGLIPAAECNRESMVIDAVLLRIMVDHLKQNALNSEAIGNPSDAASYITRALQALTAGNEGGRFKDEIANLNRELERIRKGSRGEAGRGREDNALLQGLQAQAANDGVGLKRPHYDGR